MAGYFCDAYTDTGSEHRIASDHQGFFLITISYTQKIVVNIILVIQNAALKTV